MLLFKTLHIKMATKYLEIDSTYRNRKLWPEASEFEVLISKSGQNNAVNAEDPVSKATPTISFTSNLFNATIAGSTTLSGSVVGAATSSSIIVFQTGAGELHQSENYYRHAVISNSVSNERVRILKYEYIGNDKGRITIDRDLTLSFGDTITIEDPTDMTDPSFAHVFIPTGSNSPGQYISSLLYNETLNQFRSISGYDSTIGTVTLDGAPVVGWLPTHNYSIRKERPVLVTTAAVGSTATTVVLTSGPANAGQFIRIPKTIYDNGTTPPQDEIRRVVAYDANTLSATVSPGFTTAPTGNAIEILAFSYDNFHPFVYNGSKQSEMSIYEIKLNSLVLPNQPLSVGNGGKIAFYPYLHIQLSVEGQSENIMYSNNPNSRHVLFRASMVNIENLTESTFITLKGDDEGMKQTVRFKTETNFKFKVTLPNGEAFSTVLNESFSPQEPNALIQISALFELKKI